MAESAALADSARDALGYLGGCILALSLVPQVIKLLLTRNAADISLMWSLLYLLGSALSFIYLVLLGAVAAWVPIVVELCGCLATISLKLLFDHTRWGRNQELMLELELDTQQPEAATAAAPALAAAAGVVAKGAVSAVMEAGEVAVDVLLPAEQQGQGQDGKQPQPAAGKQQLLPTSLAAPAQQQQQQQQQQQPTLRQRTKKRVMLAAPLTAAEAAEAAAAVASGDIVLKLGLQLPHNPLQRGSLNSAGSTAASTPRGDASGVVFYDSSDGAGSRGGPRWGSRTASARKVPWYLQTGISHHSVLPPASPRQAAAVAAAAATAATAAAVPAPDSPRRGRAFSNSLFSPTGSSSEVTPHRGGFLMRRQWSLFGRDAGAAAGDRQQEASSPSGAAEGVGVTSAPFHM
ncbi:hypothetical protein OEZ86_013973 [Tetradesmus obliquus]|nr:hypothetical protein OEZ86_013973 [Tetradesmus obliquus]